MEAIKHTYYYDGPVIFFGTCLMDHWKAYTTAVSEAKALNNLKYKYKVLSGSSIYSQVELPGQLYLQD